MEVDTVTYEAIESVLKDEYQTQLTRGWRNGVAPVEIPVYTNTLALEKGTELLLPWKQAAPKESKGEGAASALWKAECRRQLKGATNRPSGQVQRQPSV